MRGYLAYAEGSPCPTLVLRAETLPATEAELVATLTGIHLRLRDHDAGHVLKIALVAPSRTPGHDLEYRFAQCLPGDPPRFDLRGSCGHSVLSSVLVGARAGWLPALRTGADTRVHVRNNDDVVVCRADEVAPDRASFTVRFPQRHSPGLAELLLFGEPVTQLRHPGGVSQVSAVSVGNPYVFVNAADLGCADALALFAADDLIGPLRTIRAAAERRLGWSPGAFPKIAAVCGMDDGAIAVRSISVPTWHPTLALTGAVCLAAAAAVPGTIPARLGSAAAGELRVRTAVGDATIRSSVVDSRLAWVSVAPKAVTFLGVVDFPGRLSAPIARTRPEPLVVR